jgi:thiol-disulfide isomerase/thioredoxin
MLMNRTGVILAAVISAALAVLIVWGTGKPKPPQDFSPSSPATAPGSSAETAAMPAPDASSVTLAGQKWNLRDQHGKVVLLDFWATWCPPCRESIPEIKKIYEQFKDNGNFLLVGVSLDYEKADLEPFLKRHDIGWLQLFDRDAEADMTRKFGVSGIPTTFLIDSHGNVKGANLPADELTREIERLLKTSR